MGSKLFWESLAIMFLALAAVNFVGVLLLDAKLSKARDAFKKDYGFNTYEVFKILAVCLKFAGIVASLGFILAALAAYAT